MNEGRKLSPIRLFDRVLTLLIVAAVVVFLGTFVCLYVFRMFLGVHIAALDGTQPRWLYVLVLSCGAITVLGVVGKLIRTLWRERRSRANALPVAGTTPAAATAPARTSRAG